MEKPENREKYLKNFEVFSKKVKVTEEMKKKLREHKLVYFREQMEIVEVCYVCYIHVIYVF
jgi:hypothetical protein